MERATFMDYLFQKNQKIQTRKLSHVSPASTQLPQQNKYLVNTQSYSQYNQLPAFINRKVKNLKPYHNAKRFTVQTRETLLNNKDDLTTKKIDVTIESKKNHIIQKFDQEDAIFTAKGESSIKVPEICIYEQFLQKTKSKFTNFVNFTKNQKTNKDQYNRQIKPHQAKFKAFPRRSLGTQLNELCLKTRQVQSLTESKPYTKSVNQLVRGCDQAVTTKQVIILSKINRQEEANKYIITPKDYKNNYVQKNSSNLFTPSQKLKKDCQETPQIKTLNSNINSTRNNDKEYSFKNTYSVPKHTQQNSNFKQEKSLQEAIPVSLSKNIIGQQGTPLHKKVINKGNLQTIKKGISISSKKQIKKQQFLMLNQKQRQKHIFNTEIGSPSKKNVNNYNQVKQIQLQISPPNISAYSYIIYEPDFSKNIIQKNKQSQNQKSSKMFNNFKIHSGLNGKTTSEIASLTKIMTFTVIIEICQRFNLDSQKETVRIGKFQSNINGTSAQIQEGQIYTVRQLCYGLMLPSGNDASLALAVFGGKKLLSNQIKTSKKFQKTSNMISAQSSIKQIPGNNQKNTNASNNQGLSANLYRFKKKKCYQRFILQMNKKARLLGMAKTNYANSHGLANCMNKSCAYDLALLCQYAMKNQIFKKIVSTKVYEGVIQVQQQIEIQTIIKPMTSTTTSQESKSISNQKFSSTMTPLISSTLNNPQHLFQCRQKKSFHNYDDDVQHQNQNDTQQSEDFDNQQKNQEQIELIKTTRKQIVYYQKKIKWENTQKLLQKDQYIGIKTGITTSAGPCLASCIKTEEGRFFIIIVLNCKKLNYRFRDTQTLRKWLFKKQGIKKAKTPILVKKYEEEESDSDPE